MEFNILPYVGIGTLRFGMTVEQVRNQLAVLAQPFNKVSWAAHPTDAFDEVGLHVFYTADGKCEAFELAAPAKPTLHGTPLVGAAFDAVRDFLQGVDPALDVDESGATSRALGVAIYCPSHESTSGALVEGVLVFERGYYDEPSARDPRDPSRDDS
jgi:hypothetical protein